LRNDYSDLKEKFGMHIKKLRESQGLALREMATKCELDYSQISKIENAKWDVQLSTIFELAKGLGIELKELLNFKI
jgi:transcriptional regulator with XRE-family HTH domain